LQIQDNPAITTNHFPELCNNCGKSLLYLEAIFLGERQIIDTAIKQGVNPWAKLCGIAAI